MRATKHSHISSSGNLSITRSHKKVGTPPQKQHKHLLLLFPKVKNLVALSLLTAPGADADADQQHHR